jgi:hypothetical protein
MIFCNLACEINGTRRSCCQCLDPISGLHCMLRDVSAPLVFPEEPSSLSTPSSPNSPISNQPDLLPATAAVDCFALDAFLLLVFARDTNGGRGPCCQVGAVGRRFKAGAARFCMRQSKSEAQERDNWSKTRRLHCWDPKSQTADNTQ